MKCICSTGYRHCNAVRDRQQQWAAMELTWVQIQLAPVTTDCPPEELL